MFLRGVSEDVRWVLQFDPGHISILTHGKMWIHYLLDNFQYDSDFFGGKNFNTNANSHNFFDGDLKEKFRKMF